MSLVHAAGPIVGNSASNMQALFTVWDDAFADVDPADVLAYVETVMPTSIFGMLPTDDPQIVERAGHVYQVIVDYTPPDSTPPDPPPVPDTGSLVRGASFQAKGKRVLTCVEPIQVWHADHGDYTSKLPKTKWTVNAQGQGFERFQILGLDVEPLTESFALTYYAPNVSITKAYLDTIARLCGKFNDTEWNGYAQGELQLVRFNLNERTPDDWELSFGFGYAPTRFSVQISEDITIDELRGSWGYWTRTREVYVAAENLLEVEPYECFVQRYWDEDDFNLLDLPAMS